MKELVARFNLASPSFFVKIQKIGIILTTLSVIILSLEAQSPAMELPVFVHKLAEYLAIAGSIAATIAKLTVSDQEQLKQKVNE
jgi:hypothetical protein